MRRDPLKINLCRGTDSNRIMKIIQYSLYRHNHNNMMHLYKHE